MLPGTSESSPFLGLPGSANLLQVTRAGGRTSCAVNPMVRTALLVMLGIFALGGGVVAFQAGGRIGWIVMAMGIPGLVLAHGLIGRLAFSKRLEISKGELTLHTGQAFPHRLRKAEVRDVRVETVRYTSDEGNSCDNHLLVLESKDGERAWLALSPDQGLIDGLLEDCRKALGS